VQQQQAKRLMSGADEVHEELAILDELGLAEESIVIRLKELLLANGDGDDAVSKKKQLTDYIHERLEKDNGETFLDVGLEDVGESMEFSLEQWKAAIARLEQCAAADNADISILLSRNVGGDVDVGPLSPKDTFCSGKVLIRRRAASPSDSIETRISVVGNVDAGKSTMLGVLVKGGLDDGRGKARVNLFRHKHEIESGRTSSVGMEIMGFDSKGGTVVSSVPGRKLSWEEIGQRSV
jgi:GTPase